METVCIRVTNSICTPEIYESTKKIPFYLNDKAKEMA